MFDAKGPRAGLFLLFRPSAIAVGLLRLNDRADQAPAAFQSPR